MTKTFSLFASVLALGVVAALPAQADGVKTFELTIKDHKFQPERLVVPAGEDFVVVVKNEDDTPEEFESHDLHREKVINGHSTGKVRLGGLKPGEYAFVGEFHEDTAKGVIVAE
ncbi:cupredoxin domain-containing protein [Aestuariispira ectoiniformans]|uniref:cupredoxin domain-containing protein n=1 Tax=Aestuariispira ectoiniformans TaxID=2775080 RepID=UPI00223B0A0A|nr:cupredoxin domain-containing protein [Aestuariispira ectoiniformans]